MNLTAHTVFPVHERRRILITVNEQTHYLMWAQISCYFYFWQVPFLKTDRVPGLMVGCQQTGVLALLFVVNRQGFWPYGWLSTDRGSGLIVGCQQTGVLALWLVVNRQGFWPYGWLSTDRLHGWLSTDRGSGLIVGCQQTGSLASWLAVNRQGFWPYGLCHYGWLSTDKPTAGLLGPKNTNPWGAKIKSWYPLQNCHTVIDSYLHSYRYLHNLLLAFRLWKWNSVPTVTPSARSLPQYLLSDLGIPKGRMEGQS